MNIISKPFSRLPFSKLTKFLLAMLLLTSYSGFTQDRKNIVWIVCEDLSPFIGSYGDAIVNTPNIDALAKDGETYTRVYTTAGVCAPSRSSIITGMNQISIGTQHMRTLSSPQYLPEGVPKYSAVIPQEVKPFPEYLRKVGYYTTNNAKEDYQFEAPVTVWDESSPAATYQNRNSGQPFFSVFNLAITHESQIISPPDSLYYEPSEMELPFFYEDNDEIRHDQAALYTRVEQMDSDVGEVVAQLKADGVYDDSYVIFYSDHGGNLPWTKREVLERGLHIPFIVKYPKGKNAGTINNDLISSIDFAPSMLSIAGVEIPSHLQGKAFLGLYKSDTKNEYVFAARDRMDAQYDRVRSVTDGTFRYVYNFYPELPKYQNIAYRTQMSSMKKIIAMRDSGTIKNKYLLDWFKTPKPKEELYYTAKDPDEILNLANDPAYKEKLEELKGALFQWLESVKDYSETPEKEMVRKVWWNGRDDAPRTAKPKIRRSKEGISIECKTKGASIGYRIFEGSPIDTTISRPIHTWGFYWLFSDGSKKTIEVPKPWTVYTGGTIPLRKGQTIQVNAHRIGYKPSEKTYEF